MSAKSCLPTILALLLVEGTTVAAAETPLLPDPVAPAVIGRPLEQIRPTRRPEGRPAPARPEAARQAKAKPAAGTQAPARKSAAAPPAAGASEDAPAPQRQAKKAVDDRADPRMRLDDVGKGVHLARKPLGTGVYFDTKDRAYVRRYYEQHPVPAEPASWQVGQPVPRGASSRSVPEALKALLPKLPPGHRYVQVGGEVLLVAESGMVVDGISRSPR